jgi:hypothetical protein
MCRITDADDPSCRHNRKREIIIIPSAPLFIHSFIAGERGWRRRAIYVYFFDCIRAGLINRQIDGDDGKDVSAQHAGCTRHFQTENQKKRLKAMEPAVVTT